MLKKTEKPLVTIVTSMYKVEKYISQCLESCISQTYKNIEVIVVDDGSPDKSGAIAEEFAQKDSRIKVIHQENGGFGAGRNTGLDAAQGDYICFLDADDYLMPDFVEYMLFLVKSTDAEIAISRNCFTSSDNKQILNDSVSTISGRDAMVEFFYPYIQLGSWNKIYKMSFIRAHNLRFIPELTTGEGLQFITYAASLAKKVVVGKRKVYVYRTNNPISATTKANVQKQGLGCLATMNYIKSHLILETRKEYQAFDWHLTRCYRYCLQQIINSGEKNSFKKLYKECVKKCRFGSFRQLFYPISLNLKMRALFILFSPVLYTKLQIAKKNRILQRQ